jgi:hypothetical protein
MAAATQSTAPASTSATAASTDKVASTEKDYTVAKGRTVTADRDYGPGETITLSIDEGKSLQKRGFLVSDDGDVVIDETAGPAVVNGVDIKEA